MLYYYINTSEIPGFLLLLKNRIFMARSEHTIFIFHMWGNWCCHSYWNDHHCYSYIIPLKVLRYVAVWSKHHRCPTFGNLRKLVGSLRKIVKNVVIMSSLCLCNKQNITCPLVDMNFIFSCPTRHLSSRTLEDKIHIHARSCNILYVNKQLENSP